MKVTQDEGFKPITIVLETPKEAMAFREIMDEISIQQVGNAAYDLSVELSDMFTDCRLKV
jgi:hypothetical protein